MGRISTVTRAQDRMSPHACFLKGFAIFGCFSRKALLSRFLGLTQMHNGCVSHQQSEVAGAVEVECKGAVGHEPAEDVVGGVCEQTVAAIGPRMNSRGTMTEKLVLITQVLLRTMTKTCPRWAQVGSYG